MEIEEGKRNNNGIEQDHSEVISDHDSKRASYSSGLLLPCGLPSLQAKTLASNEMNNDGEKKKMVQGKTIRFLPSPALRF